MRSLMGTRGRAPTRVAPVPNIGTHYGWNWSQLGADTWARSLGAVTRPAETIAYTDSVSYVVHWYQHWYRPHDVHNEGVNVCYVDGHVKWTRRGEIYTGTDTADGPVESTSRQAWWYLYNK